MNILLTCSCSSVPNFAKHYVAKKYHISIPDITLYIGIPQYKIAMSQFPLGSPARKLLEAKLSRTRKYALYLDVTDDGQIIDSLDVLKGVPISA